MLLAAAFRRLGFLCLGSFRSTLPPVGIFRHFSSSSSNMWDERYAETDFAYGTAPNDFLKKILPTLEGVVPQTSSCLLLAEGEGRNAVYMAQQGWPKPTAVDSSSVGLVKAQKLANDKGVAIAVECADLATYELGGGEGRPPKWDCIVGISCHLPPPIRDRVLQNVPRALKPGGYFVLEAYTPQQLEYKTGGPPAAEMMYSRQILQDAFEGHLEIVRNQEVVREVVEGKYHTGRAAVVQFVGRKPKN